jgi:hypothetical protein
LNVF